MVLGDQVQLEFGITLNFFVSNLHTFKRIQSQKNLVQHKTETVGYLTKSVIQAWGGTKISGNGHPISSKGGMAHKSG